MKTNHHHDLAALGFPLTARHAQTAEFPPPGPARFSPFKFRIHVRPGRQPHLVHRGMRKPWKPDFVETITHN